MLSWLIGDELKRESELKRQDYEVMALAANQGTNPGLLKNLQKTEDPDAPSEENIEWITPQSAEEIQEVMQRLSGLPS